MLLYKYLFSRNIPFGAEEEEVAEVFQEFGDLAYTRLVVDKVSGRPGGSVLLQCECHCGRTSKIVCVHGLKIKQTKKKQYLSRHSHPYGIYHVMCQ